MILRLFEEPMKRRPMDVILRAVDAEYEPFRKELIQAGLDETKLRQMDPDDRVATLEQAKLDPFDYIYLAC